MPKKRQENANYLFSRDEQNPEFVDAIVHAGEGPSRSAVPDPSKRRRMITTQISKQEAFIAKFNGEGILNNLYEHERRLHQSGSVGFDYGEIDNEGNMTFSGHHLFLNPSGIPLGEGGRVLPHNNPLPSPQLKIGLFGNAGEMSDGNDNYMTHLAVVMVDTTSREAYSKAYARSRRRKNKLADIDPSLNPDQFSQRKWNRIRRKAEKRASQLLNAKLNENKRIGLVERRTRKIVATSRGFILGGLADVGLEKIFPPVIQAIQQVLHHIK